MSFTLRQLRYFVSAVETGKLSAAAAECGVSQSAVTLALKSLEDQVGTQLLERTPTGVSLTPDGFRFLPKAREILSSVAEATRGLRHSPGSTQGLVRIGVTYTVIGYFLGPHLARFQRRFSGIEVKVEQLERPELEEALITGDLDLAVMLVSNLNRRKGIGSQVLQHSPRRLWLPPGHPLLRERAVTLADVAKQPYVMLTVDEAAQTAMKYWNRTGAAPKVVLETSSVEAVRTLVANGVGVTILSDMVYRPWSLEGERIEVRSLDDNVPSMDVGLVWPAGKADEPAAKEFRSFLQVAYARPSFA